MQRSHGMQGGARPQQQAREPPPLFSSCCEVGHPSAQVTVCNAGRGSPVGPRMTALGPGCDMESFEWVLFAELSDKEIKEHPSFKLDDLGAAASITGGTSVGSGPRAPQPVRQLPLPSIAPPAAKPQPSLPTAAAAPANQVEFAESMTSDLCARGHSSAVLHALLDEAAGSAEIPQSTPVPIAGPGVSVLYVLPYRKSHRVSPCSCSLLFQPVPPGMLCQGVRAPVAGREERTRHRRSARVPGGAKGGSQLIRRPALAHLPAGASARNGGGHAKYLVLAQAPHTTESETPHGTSTSPSSEAASRRTTTAGHRERASPVLGAEPDAEGEDSAKGARAGGLGSGVRGAQGGAEANGGVRRATGSHATKRSGAPDGEQAGFAAPGGPVPAGSQQAPVRGGAEQQPPRCASARSDEGEMGSKGDAGTRPGAMLGASPMEVGLDGAPLGGAGIGVLWRPGTEMGTQGTLGVQHSRAETRGSSSPLALPTCQARQTKAGQRPRGVPQRGPVGGNAPRPRGLPFAELPCSRALNCRETSRAWRVPCCLMTTCRRQRRALVVAHVWRPVKQWGRLAGKPLLREE
eukprot:jgi/Botrbrau1/91/Bobra.0022s0081.1